MRNFRRLAFAFVVVLAFCHATAEGSGNGGGAMHFKPEEIMKFSKKVEATLAEKGARVAIVARVGRPRNKLPRGIAYTHTGLAVYSQITTGDGRRVPGYAMYNLYQRSNKPNVSDLVQDYPVDFFAEVQVLEAGVIIPSPELQKRLLQVIASPTYRKLHNPYYSIIANPFKMDFQNCTGHTLDVIVAAIYQTDDIGFIKANEKAYFDPQSLDINPIKLALGSVLSSDVTTSDHSGRPATATFETIGWFLTQYDAASEILTITP